MKIKNRYYIIRDFLFKRAVTKGCPVEYYLEIAKKCNLRCIMHSIAHDDRPEGFMQPEVFENIISKIAPHAEVVYFTGSGEPLLHPHFIDYVSELRKRKLPTVIGTNCTLLTPDISEKILLNNVSYIIMPLDGITKKTYESIRVNAKFETVLSNIKKFLELKRKLKKRTFVQLQMIDMNENRHEIDGFASFVKKLDTHNQVNSVRIKPFVDFTRQVSSTSCGNSTISNPCFLLWRNMFITYTGIASGCPQDGICVVPLGDFKRDSLEEIWNSKVMQNFRRLHCEGGKNEKPLCANCDLRQQYFTPFTVLATLFFSGSFLKKHIADYEKYALRQT